MKKSVHWFAIASLHLATAVGFGAMQTWKSTAGTTIEAEYVNRTATTVTLRTAEGRAVVVSLAALAQESHAQLPSLASATNGETPTAPAAAPTELAATGTSDAPKLSTLSRPGGIAVPTDEEIAAFKTTWKEDDGTTYTFAGGLGPQVLTKKDQGTAARHGKIPFRVTAYFSKSKVVGSKTRSSLVDGSAYIVVLNEAGEVVVTRRENLLKLCPS